MNTTPQGMAATVPHALTTHAGGYARALAGSGVEPGGVVHANLTAPMLVTHALRRDEGRLSAEGALIVKTGIHTGRSVADKFSVDHPEISGDIWWRHGNQKLDVAHFEILKGRVQAYLQGRELFTQDLYAGADPAHRVRVRLVSTEAWHTLFARNMFIRPSETELETFEPDYVILHAPNFQADPAIDGVRSSTAIAVSFVQRMIVIAGTEYGGEIKKSIFGVMNWKLPAEGVMPMHCSANVGRTTDGSPGDVALFFGLSGTGKTTLSSDPDRPLADFLARAWIASQGFAMARWESCAAPCCASGAVFEDDATLLKLASYIVCTFKVAGTACKSPLDDCSLDLPCIDEIIVTAPEPFFRINLK